MTLLEGMNRAIQYIEENLDQEKEMARTVQSLGKTLGKEAKAQMKDAEQANS